MKPVSIILILLIAAGSVSFSDGQTKSKRHLITGYVTDRYYYPVAGVFIMTDGETSDIITDERGYYKITVASDAESIGVYSLTYGIIEESINGRTRINFTFSKSVSGKNISAANTEESEDKEEINVGYGTRKRSELTTSVSKIDGNERRFSGYSSIYEMIKGNLPGVLVNGDKILIRGFTSIWGSNEPLFVVDGIPVSSIADISPEMVKSIEVLKGSAAAIYGSRGANGVILIDQVGAPEIINITPVEGIKVPFADTQTATNVQSGSATLNGTVNPNDLSAFVTFEYGSDTEYGNYIQAVQNPVSGNFISNVSAVVTDLDPGITYHYRVVATNSFGSTAGLDLPFTTPGGIPVAESGSATKTTPAKALLNGVVNPNDLPTTVTFEYGTDTNYISRITALQSPVKGNSTVSASANVTGLSAGTTYYYRIVAANEKGTVRGADKTFIAEYKLGEFQNGGYIFYIDETGQHGLICAPSDQSKIAIWGNCVPPGATGRAIGTGNQNTDDIVNNCSDSSTAASLCFDLEINGYNDWFLPSINELYLMYINLHEKGLGRFKESYYWSSTQDKYGAWVVSFYYGSKSNHNRNENSILTRAIRAF